jgi:hypothetical protein
MVSSIEDSDRVTSGHPLMVDLSGTTSLNTLGNGEWLEACWQNPEICIGYRGNFAGQLAGM